MSNRSYTRQILPLVSVVIAVTALLYSTWRNETTEEQRSLRQAGFAVLERLTALEGHIFVMAYTGADERSVELPFLAWAAAREIRDLAEVLPAPLPAEARTLFTNWSGDFEVLSGWTPGDVNSRRAARAAADRLSDEIQALRQHIIVTVSAFT